jgi:hypothetical protein
MWHDEIITGAALFAVGIMVGSVMVWLLWPGC